MKLTERLKFIPIDRKSWERMVGRSEREEEKLRKRKRDQQIRKTYGCKELKRRGKKTEISFFITKNSSNTSMESNTNKE